MTQGHCDCGTPIATPQGRHGAEGKLDELRRKGWSKYKIERWLAQKSNTAREQKHAHELQAWVEWLQLAVAEGHGARLGFFVDDDGGSSLPYPPERSLPLVETHRIAEVDAADRENARRGVLYFLTG